MVLLSTGFLEKWAEEQTREEEEGQESSGLEKVGVSDCREQVKTNGCKEDKMGAGWIFDFSFELRSSLILTFLLKCPFC